jgi:hypothetical protein
MPEREAEEEPAYSRGWLGELQRAAAAGAVVTLLVRFRHLVGPDGDPWRSTRRKAKRASATSFRGSMQLFGKGASAERVIEQLGGDPEGQLESWASERTDGGEAEGVTSVEVFVLDGWPKE